MFSLFSFENWLLNQRNLKGWYTQWSMYHLRYRLSYYSLRRNSRNNLRFRNIRSRRHLNRHTLWYTFLIHSYLRLIFRLFLHSFTDGFNIFFHLAKELFHYPISLCSLSIAGYFLTFSDTIYRMFAFDNFLKIINLIVIISSSLEIDKILQSHFWAVPFLNGNKGIKGWELTFEELGLIFCHQKSLRKTLMMFDHW